MGCRAEHHLDFAVWPGPGLAVGAPSLARGKPLVETLVSLPLVVPPVATGLLLLKVLGRRGAVGGFLHREFALDVVFTWRGVLLALAVMSFPLLVRSARVAFEEVNPRLEQIARTLGAGKLPRVLHHHPAAGVTRDRGGDAAGLCAGVG